MHLIPHMQLLRSAVPVCGRRWRVAMVMVGDDMERLLRYLSWSKTFLQNIFDLASLFLRGN